MPRGKKKSANELSADEVLSALAADGMKIALEIPDQEFISTGNMALDAITNGGIPRGKVTELAGPQASGKTTTAVSAAASVIQEGGRVIFLDYERTIDKPYFRSLGVDPDDQRHFVYAAPTTLEQGANATRKLVQTGEFDLVIFDSVAKMITEKARNDDISGGMNLDRAKMMYQFLDQAVEYASDYNTALVFLNHLLEKVDITFMGQQLAARGIKQYTTRGGNALPFYASLRLFYRKTGDISSEIFDPLTNSIQKTKIGYRHEVRVAKNKVGKPEGKAEIINILGEGFSQSRTAFEILKSYDAIKKSGAWYSAKDARLIEVLGSEQTQGEENFYQKLFSQPASKGVAITLARELLAESYSSLTGGADNEETYEYS